MIKRLTMTEDEALHILGYCNNTGRYKFSDQTKWKEALEKRTKFRRKESEVISQMSAMKTDGQVMDIDEYCDYYNIDRDSVRSFKLITHTGNPFYNIQSNNVDDLENSIITISDISEIINSLDHKPKKVSPKVNSNEILRIIITDVHIGMETDDKGYGIFSEVWNEKVAFDRLDIIIEECNRIKRNFKEIHVICLGDYQDGYNGQTTRGGHNLPQNLSNRQAFDVGVRFKYKLYNRVQDLFDCRVIAYNVCNDNHSSDFGFITNETVRLLCEKTNLNISVNNLERFMSHYTFGDHCFILCHGKDEKHMKFGLKPKLDAVIKDRILQYIKHYDIDSKYITFEKGDSHLQLLDSTSSNDFEYFNYRAFSNASSWVNHNFGKSTSGFTLMTVRENVKSKGIEAIEF